MSETTDTTAPGHGHKKLATGGLSGLTLTPLIAWLWSLIDAAFPEVNLAMPPEVVALIGPAITAYFFYRTPEDTVG